MTDYKDLIVWQYTVPMIVDTAKLANPILWTAG